MNRWLIYVPEINRRSFAFFYFKGASGRSWSIREYLGPAPAVRYAKDFPASWTAERILEMARREGCFAVPAPTVSTDDVAFWRERIGELNREHLGIEPAPSAAPAAAPAERVAQPRFPMLDLDLLQGLPKAGKREDLRRILTSPRSEDYVTWNISRLVERAPVGGWWPGLVGLAEAQAGPQGLGAADLPAVGLWRLVPSPAGCERASRERMRHSGNPDWVARAGITDPVEGVSEIDLVLSGASYLVFVEAKLDSDVSLRTTYDPERNQILRNVDCLLEEAGGRIPRFWMLAKDRHPTRAYVDLIAGYRRDPGAACALLPHRAPADVREVIESAAVITWRELLSLLPDASPASPERVVAEEVRRRVG